MPVSALFNEVLSLCSHLDLSPLGKRGGGGRWEGGERKEEGREEKEGERKEGKVEREDKTGAGGSKEEGEREEQREGMGEEEKRAGNREDFGVRNQGRRGDGDWIREQQGTAGVGGRRGNYGHK